MDQDLDARMRKIEQLVTENNTILKQMRRVQKNANLMKLGYWLILIVVGIFAAIMIKPYIDMISGGSDTNTSSPAGLLEQYNQLREEL